MPASGALSKIRYGLRVARETSRSINAVALSVILLLFLLFPSHLGSSFRSVMDNIFGSMKSNGVAHASGEFHGAKLNVDMADAQNVAAQQQSTITNLTQQIKILYEYNKTLGDAVENYKTLKPSVASSLVNYHTPDKQKTSEILRQADQSKSSFQTLMVSSAGEDSKSRYGVVIGGDARLSIVEAQIRRANSAGFSGVYIYKIGNIFNNIITTASLDDAKSILPRVKAIDKYAASAYLINISKWCPTIFTDQNGVNNCTN